MSTVHRFVFGQPDQGCQCAECKEDRILEAAPDLVIALLKVQTDMLRKDFSTEADRRSYVLAYVGSALKRAGL